MTASNPTPAAADANGWRPIESAPRDGTVFLGYDAFVEYQIARMDEGMFRSWETGKVVYLSGWQPLPLPPVTA